MIANKNIRIAIYSIPLFLILCFGCISRNDTETAYQLKENVQITTGNPILPGYYADPEIIEFEGKFYIYTTIDPWGGFEIAVWESSDFQIWTLHGLNWPTLAACTSPTSDNSMVSSPCVVRAADGKFYMYITAGSEIWAGTSEHPLGPWYSLLPENQAMIPNLPGQSIHNIGADCFIDDDGEAYLFWGSGWNWKNGHCFMAKLADNMCSFEENPVDITPPNYFEAPNMIKVKENYYLLYSDGRCNDSTYKIRYAISDCLSGPWKEGKNSPILRTIPEKGITGPGQPAAFIYNNQWYLLYHRIEQVEQYCLLRRVCIDSLKFTNEQYIQRINPSDEGITAFVTPNKKVKNLAKNQPVYTTSELSEEYPANAITDMRLGTKWAASDSVHQASITIDLKKNKKFMNVYTWFEYAFRVSHYTIEYSKDNRNWILFSDKRYNEERGAPRVDSKVVKARYIRMTIYKDTELCNRPAIWEIMID
jgi:beta-xylosidase